jgi:hypothetical protein
MKTWPLEDAGRPRDRQTQEAIDSGELSGELEGQVTGALVSIVLHQHHDSHSHQEVAS